MSKRRIALGITASVTTLCVVTLVVGSWNWKKYYDLANHGFEKEGWITAKEPGNHMSVRYSYTVNSQTFNGLESIGNSINSLNVGDKVRVFYIPNDPAIGCLCNPKDKLKTETVTILLAALTSALIVFINFRATRKAAGS